MAVGASLCYVIATKEVFHSVKNSGLNFKKFPVPNGTTFSGTSGKEDNIARYMCTKVCRELGLDLGDTATKCFAIFKGMKASFINKMQKFGQLLLSIIK